jgi:hypothetical protein
MWKQFTTDAEPVLAVQQGRGAQIRKGKMKLEKSLNCQGGELLVQDYWITVRV